MMVLQRLLLLFALCVPFTAQAQLSLAVDSVDMSAFPEVSLHVRAAQGSLLLRDLDSSDFALREDGFPQRPLHHMYPPATQQFSVVFVISTGSLMSESGVEQAKGIADRIMNWMDGAIDEAAIFGYSSINVGATVEMTSNVPFLRIGLNSIQRTAAGTNLWDGALVGAEYCRRNGIQPMRAMVLLSNGKADGGNVNVTDAINVAKLGNIVVYTVGINAVGFENDLKLLAEQTGGEYFASGDLAVQEIGLALSGRPHHSVLSYTSDNPCRDGVDRGFSVQVKSGNDSVSTNATAALGADPGTNVSAVMKPESTTGTAGGTIAMPFSIAGSVAGQRLYEGDLTLTFDTALVKLSGVDASGGQAKNNTFQVSMNATGAVLHVGGVSKLSGPGTLFHLQFSAANVGTKQNVAVALASTDFLRGCLDVTTGSGTLTVNPKQYKLGLSANPLVFTWNSGGKRYNPDPGVMTMDVRNDGDLAVSGLTATLAPNDGVRIAFGGSRTVAIDPPSLDPGQTGTATWYVQALPRPAEGTERIKATVESDQGATASMDLFMNIKAADVALRFSGCAVSDVIIDAGSHQPKPAAVTTNILSAGTADAPAGEVAIVLPASGELTLVGGSASQPFGALTSGASAPFQWEVDYPTSEQEAAYGIMLVRTASGLPDDTCFLTLTVPGLTEASLELTCSGDDFTWNPSTVTYDPAPGVVRVTVTNNGVTASAALTASLDLPDGLDFAPGEQADLTHAPLAPAETWQAEWKVAVLWWNCDSDETQLNFDVTLTPEGASAQNCRGVLTLGSANSAAPVVSGSTPDAFDTLVVNTEQTFSVTAADPDGTQLSYEWHINGVAAPSNTSTLTHTFDQLGATTVRCAILDACASSFQGDTTFVTWRFEVVNTTAAERVPGAAGDFALLGNFPNPFNPGTTVRFAVPAGTHDVTVDVLDATGRVVTMLSQGRLTGGRYAVYFDASQLASGPYFARLRSGTVQMTAPMLLVK